MREVPHVVSCRAVPRARGRRHPRRATARASRSPGLEAAAAGEREGDEDEGDEERGAKGAHGRTPGWAAPPHEESAAPSCRGRARTPSVLPHRGRLGRDQRVAPELATARPGGASPSAIRPGGSMRPGGRGYLQPQAGFSHGSSQRPQQPARPKTPVTRPTSRSTRSTRMGILRAGGRPLAGPRTWRPPAQAPPCEGRREASCRRGGRPQSSSRKVIARLTR